MGGYVADIVGENGVIEIQTRQFNKLLKKLEAFLDYCDVTVVYPYPCGQICPLVDTETESCQKSTNRRENTLSMKSCPELYKIKYNPLITPISFVPLYA